MNISEPPISSESRLAKCKFSKYLLVRFTSKLASFYVNKHAKNYSEWNVFPKILRNA